MSGGAKVPDAADWVGAMIPRRRDSSFATRNGIAAKRGAKREPPRRAPGHFGAKLRPRLISRRYAAKLPHMTVHTPTQFQKTPRFPQEVHFDRQELGTILGLYGRMVAAGEWRDYGISSLREVAVFAVFRRTAEQPLYRIEKRPKLRHRQGLYSVVAMDGQILKRGHDLKTVLRVLERKLIRAVD